MCGVQARKGNMNKTYITKQRTNTSSIEMAMSMAWYGCSVYTRLGKTAVNSILFAPVLPALLLRNGSLAAKQRNKYNTNRKTQSERPNPKRRHPISKGGTQSEKEAPNLKSWYLISEGGTQSQKLIPNLKTIKNSQN